MSDGVASPPSSPDRSRNAKYSVKGISRLTASTQEHVQRLPFGLCAEIPQRHLDGTKCASHRSDVGPDRKLQLGDAAPLALVQGQRIKPDEPLPEILDRRRRIPIGTPRRFP